jgi:hypothetical protein
LPSGSGTSAQGFGLVAETKVPFKRRFSDPTPPPPLDRSGHRYWCHLEWNPLRNTGHSRESGNPLRRRRISNGLRGRFPFSRE